MDLSELIESIDIVEYISQFVELEEKNGEFWGLSPFSSEKTPSFSVRRESKSFYCFSSGIGGNVLTFTRFYYKCGYTAAINILKEFAGLDGEKIIAKNKMVATSLCNKYKERNPIKISDAKPKRIYDQNCMEMYEKNDEKLSVWEKEGISRRSLDEFQVYYDRFSDRLVYPIRNTLGQIVNIGGRTLDPNWKEKKLRKYTYFSGWGTMDLIYGLYENMSYVLEKRELIIFEGCKSVLLANTWGIKNCGALLTSHLNPAQLMLLIKLGVRVVFGLDTDVDIMKDHNISKLKNYVNVEFLVDKNNLLEPKDAPVDKGYETFNILYKNRRRYR